MDKEILKQLKKAGYQFQQQEVEATHFHPGLNGASCGNTTKIMVDREPLLEEIIDEIEFKWLGKGLSTLTFSKSTKGSCVVNWQEKEGEGQTYTITGKSWLEVASLLYIKRLCQK